MAWRVDWQGDKWIASMRSEMKKRTTAASIRLANRVKADISQPGDLRVRGMKGGTIYNFTHSRPGNPPYKQKGTLRRKIEWEIIVTKGGAAFTGRVGTNVPYGRHLELGTSRMRARPYLRPALRRYTPELRAILTRQIPKGGLPGIVSNQFRSGHFGKGAGRWS